MHVRVWAPAVQRVDVVLSGGRTRALREEGQGYFSEVIEGRAGDCYQFRLNESNQLYPDRRPAFNRMGRTARRRSSTPDRSRGTITIGPASTSRDK